MTKLGTGGDEACIFVEDIFRMFSMYFKEKSWSYEVLNSNEGGTKGFREISLSISGEEVYGKLKFESSRQFDKSMFFEISIIY